MEQRLEFVSFPTEVLSTIILHDLFFSILLREHPLVFFLFCWLAFPYPFVLQSNFCRIFHEGAFEWLITPQIPLSQYPLSIFASRCCCGAGICCFRNGNSRRSSASSLNQEKKDDVQKQKTSRQNKKERLRRGWHWSDTSKKWLQRRWH